MYLPSLFAYLYHSVNGISLGLAQSDSIKRCLLYYKHIVGLVVSTYCNLMTKSSWIWSSQIWSETSINWNSLISGIYVRVIDFVDSWIKKTIKTTVEQ